MPKTAHAIACATELFSMRAKKSTFGTLNHRNITEFRPSSDEKVDYLPGRGNRRSTLPSDARILIASRHRRSHSLATQMTPRSTPSPPTADLSRFPMRSSRPSACNHDCAQLEVIAEARGLQQIAFSTFLPFVSANYDVGEFSLGVTGNSIPIPKGPGFNFIPGVGAVPFGLNIGTSFELAELKVQWLLLDFGRRLGRYEQSRLATEIAGLQTGRAYQTVANEVAVAYYNILRSQALRRTAQDALRRSEEELVDARKRQREGVIEREVVLRAEVQHAETLQAVHTATETEFTALAALNLAIGLKCNEPVRVLEPPEAPPIGISLAECLETAVRERREFGVIRSTVEIALQGTRVARADFAPRVIADGTGI